MSLLDSIIGIYGLLICNNKIINHLYGPLRYMLRGLANYCLPKYLKKQTFHKSEKVVEEKIIVSLTSFPARINNVWMVIECMLRQTIKPYKIILWLSQEQFPRKDILPKSLLERENDVFNIRLVKEDIRSHKKYYYVSKEYPDSLIFLIDDDIFYTTKILERSLEKYNHFPHSVISNYGCQIKYDDNGKHLPYLTWGEINTNDNIFFGSGGGTLYCPRDLHNDLTNISLALKLTPLADDIWLNAMARLVGTKVISVSKKQILPIFNEHSEDLSRINIGMSNDGLSNNDKQLEALESYYGRCFDK